MFFNRFQIWKDKTIKKAVVSAAGENGVFHFDGLELYDRLIRIPDRNLEFFRGTSVYVILRNEVTKNLFSIEGAKILRLRSG